MTYMMLGQIITFAFIRTIMLLIIVPQSMASSKRVKEVFAAVPDMSYSQETTGTFSSEGSVSFKNVDFKYGGAEDKVLDDLNFDIKKGETLAIIGHTGSGKSTIINLLFRMYDVTKGSVEIDGLNIKNISEYDLAKKLCIVPQKAFLFNASIEDNIAYGLEGIDEKEKKQRVE
jgi:ATP-binding cassette subfamily B protein